MFVRGCPIWKNLSTFNALTSISAGQTPLAGGLVLASLGEPNAQAEDQVRRQKALQGDCHRQSDARPARQAPRHDQADQEADPSAPRYPRAVQDRRRQHQEIFLAERLIASRLAEPRASRGQPSSLI